MGEYSARHTRILLLGYAGIGVALANVLVARGHEVHLYGGALEPAPACQYREPRTRTAQWKRERSPFRYR